MMKLDNKGFAISTILYGILSMIILLLMIIFAIMKSNKNINSVFVSTIEKNLNNCVNEEIALERCYTNNSACNHKAYFTCLGISDDLYDPTANNPTIMAKLKPTAVTSGNGLYIDSYESGRYIYRGTAVNNYIKYDGRLWRIIAIESDGTARIMLNTSIGNFAWDTLANNEWEASSLNNKLSQDFYGDISDTAKLTKRVYNVGRIYETGVDISITEAIKQEKKVQYMGTSATTGIVGLISVADFAKATTNGSCTTKIMENSNCNSYLTSDDMWMINGFVGLDNSSNNAMIVRKDTTDAYYYLTSTPLKVKPVVHLSTSVTIKSGSGTSADPYIID